MHRQDVEIVNRIEMAYLENGYIPNAGQFVKNQNRRCGLGALLPQKFDNCHIANNMINSILNRCDSWINGFVLGFDMIGNQEIFDWDWYKSIEDLQFYRGFRAGWICGKRMFSKPPVELVIPSQIPISTGVESCISC